MQPSWEFDPTYYEAATVDGASKWQRIRNITIPSVVFPWLRFWPFLQSEISSAQTSVFLPNPA